MLIETLDYEQITFENLRPFYETGISSTYKTSSGKKIIEYRHGVMTSLGDIEESEWVKAVKTLARAQNEESLLMHLSDKQFAGFHCKSVREVEKAACSLYARQMHNNKSWVNYVPFNKLYRPELLKNDKDIVWVLPKCCKELFQSTRQIIKRSYDNKIECSICGRHTEFVAEM